MLLSGGFCLGQQQLIDSLKRELVIAKHATSRALIMGEGTGLGWSYNIIINGPDWMIEVISTEGIGTKFIIYLPINDTVK